MFVTTAAKSAKALDALLKSLEMICNRCQEKGAEEADRILGERGKVLALYEASL
ncbi:hypothetical protein ACFL27_22675 [candidate division CSSED10-310 bacterium]|uniref:Uncharacterized protein n=1 Tax=candidate division CSSED10-310 bacterium TaxID=2855610 RepID=A0ABV6Z3J2_UNCC1